MKGQELVGQTEPKRAREKINAKKFDSVKTHTKKEVTNKNTET